MEEIPEIYNLKTIEQMRAIADPLRLRIVDALSQRALTATGLGDALGLPANKTHYHVRELEKVGLVRIVETREKGGILEKYYRAVARALNVPGALLQTIPPDESIAATAAMLQSFTQGFLRAFARALRTPAGDEQRLTLSPGYLWMTDAEYRDTLEKVYDLFNPYRSPRGVAGEHEHAVTLFTYDTSLTREDGLAPEPEEQPSPPTEALRRPTMAAGILYYTRHDLERMVARGEALDLNAVGVLTFADDISADLIDRAVAHFRHHGVLRASPAARAALKRKEAPTVQPSKP